MEEAISNSIKELSIIIEPEPKLSQVTEEIVVTDNNTENNQVVLRELSWLLGNKLARFSAAETLEPAPVNLENVTQKLHSMKTPPGKTQSRRVSQWEDKRNGIPLLHHDFSFLSREISYIHSGVPKYSEHQTIAGTKV